MPSPCDPGSPREPPAGTNTLSPVLLWSEKQEEKWGRSEGHWVPFSLFPGSLSCYCLLFVSPEASGEQTPRKETWFPQKFSPRQSLGSFTTQSPGPQINKGSPPAKSTEWSMQTLAQADGLMLSWSQDLVSLNPGFSNQAAWSPLSRKEETTQRCSKCPFQD